jgi:hypothetical protein
MKGLKDYTGGSNLSDAPPCPPQMLWRESHADYLTWLRAKFPTAKIVGIHRSKSTPLPEVQLGSGAYLLYNYYGYVVCMATSDYARAQNLPAHSVLKEWHPSFGYYVEAGETMIECSRDCVEELLAQRIIY